MFDFTPEKSYVTLLEEANNTIELLQTKVEIAETIIATYKQLNETQNLLNKGLQEQIETLRTTVEQTAECVHGLN